VKAESVKSEVYLEEELSPNQALISVIGTAVYTRVDAAIRVTVHSVVKSATKMTKKRQLLYIKSAVADVVRELG